MTLKPIGPKYRLEYATISDDINPELFWQVADISDNIEEVVDQFRSLVEDGYAVRLQCRHRTHPERVEK